MITFRVSAPGKVILFGEHAVVHGKTAIAVSLDRRTNVVFRELDLEERHVLVELPKISVLERFPIEELQKKFHDLRDHDRSHEKLLEFIRKLINFQGNDDLHKKSSIECFFYALFQVALEQDLKIKPFHVKVDSDLTIGAGTGSSASFSVCLNAAFLLWSKLQKNPNNQRKFSQDCLKKISKYAYNCEKIMHGMPSGIDNSVCTFGSVIRFSKNDSISYISLGLNSLEILLVNTNVTRNTKKLVAKLNGLLQKYPIIFQKVLENINEVSLTSILYFEKLQKLSDSGYDERQTLFDELSLLVDINQGLLNTCQVSHTTLDLICAIAKKYKFSAKLTGAGGGGYAFVLIPPGSSKDEIRNLSEELTKNGFDVTETKVGGAGVVVDNEVE